MKKNKFISQSFLQVILIVFFTGFGFSVNAQPGTLDENFGQKGKVLTSISGLSFDIQASALQFDGKIVVVGSAFGGFLIVRYMPDGTIDSSFGNQGNVITDFNYDSEFGTCVAVTPDNYIIVGGYGSNGFVTPKYDILLSKYKPNGNLDSTFGTNGKIIKSFGYQEEIFSILLASDGKIILSGNTDADFLITRFNSNGQTDLSFGANGATITDFFDLEFARSSVLQADGKIIVTGFKNLTHPQFCLSRYLPNGKLDAEFGSQGKVVTNLINGDERIFGVGIQSTGKIVVGGMSGGSFSVTDENITLARYDTKGALDLTFGKNGFLTAPFEGVNTYAQTVLIRPDDKIIVTGASYEQRSAQALDFVLAAFTVDGIIDSSFGINGRMSTDFGGYETNGAGLLQPDGKIVLTGITTNFEETEYKIALARYLDRPEEKYVRIKKWLHHHGIIWDDKPENDFQYYCVQKSPDGINFKEIYRVSAENTSNQKNFEDHTAASGTSYYRIVAVKSEKAKTYSNTLSIPDDALLVKFYPNPAKNSLQINGLSETLPSKLSISDLNGNTRITATANASLYTLNISRLQKGNYILTIQNKDAVVKKSFIKE
ncbi:T9SS type A sorting domain-containing protein [Limnovirga soli]|jgi:uncharacterized delta-60 repeat protein|uniref:T9SS type A sorting domain-containing protein n=1 Tax=Limnovirga soli TaxID=2656915 RepID=A0A8J8JY94_9BACT|nr:T9SS type A sorting domain-containing protein [Limnovirga soli]NNV57111.1 T9SS type A sorting domain-containing protein [Limnovirga soli]